MKPGQMKAAFIDTAAEVYNKAEAEWLQADRRALVEAGFTVTDYTLTNKTQDQLKTDLTPFDLLFVTGGNTFYLLEKANLSGFTQLLKDNFFADQIYVGSSAGSVLLSNNIEAIKFLDNPDRADKPEFQAVGLLDYTILPHWGSEKFKPRFEQLLSFAYDQAQPLIAIADTQCLVVSPTDFRLVN